MGDAIKKEKGPCVILAGAGTGKTTTIVEKVKHLVMNRVYPAEKIVCITFSNEAANNLVLRIDKALGDFGKERKPVIRTFHGFSADLLRRHGDKIGLSREFKILDPDQAKVVLHRNLKVLPGNCHKYISTIGSAKDLGIKLESFREYLERGLREFEGVDMPKRLENLQFELQTLHLGKEYGKKKGIVKDIAKIKEIIELKRFVNAWSAYEKIKVKGNYQDYSDLNANALLLLEKNPEIANEFEYIIVDEFQDTNKIQLDFIEKLCLGGNITVVGDINQSIYRFRGAYKENLNLFKAMFKVTDGDVFTLAKSYRSPNKVLRAAHKLILNNYTNKDECFFVENAHSRDGEQIEVYQLKDSKEEARKVVEIIRREVEAGVPLEEICVMFRAHQHGRIIKKTLEQEGIKFYSVSKASLLKQKSVKTVYDYLIILDKIKRKDKGGEQAWWDLVYQLDFASEDLVKIGKAIKSYLGNGGRKKKDDEEKKEGEKEEKIISVYLFNNLDKLELSEGGKLASKILLDKIKAMIPFLEKPISELLQNVYRISGIVNEQKTREEKEAMLNLNKFYEIAKSHEELYDSDLVSFLYYLEVLQNLDIDIEASTLEEEGVRLMTSHSTKGLEYKVVIITNMAQGRFPIERYISNSLIPTELLPEVKNEVRGLSDEDKDEYVVNYEKHHQLLEERRLAYVSFTRAKEKLILTFAEQYGNKKVAPSAFLNEIEFKSNPDVDFDIDNEQKYVEPEIQIKTGLEFSKALSGENFEEVLTQLSNKEKVEKKEENKRLSPSALMLFANCQKEFEYKYVYNMPERKTVSWEAMRLGSFVHLVLEKGVNLGFEKVDDYLSLARQMSLEEDWQSVEIGEAEVLIRVFFERNKGKYNRRSKTEQYLPLQLGGVNFIGFADRIDFDSDGNAIIVDYKTGKTNITPRDRNWQLGFYALAAKERYGNVKRVVLDMLKQERPLEFEIDDRGNAECKSSKFIDGFNIYEVEEQLIKTAHEIQSAYKKGFKACSVEKNCDFCNEYVYGY